MAWIVKGSGALGRAVSKGETKACTLCGTLNFTRNRECRACGWRGAFEQESAAVDYHWRRLLDRHEEVRLEHVVRGSARDLDDFGRPRKVSLWHRFASACGQRWQDLLSRREGLRVARETTPRLKSVLPPN